MIRPGTILRLIVFMALIAFLAAPDRFAGLLAPLTNNGAPPIYNQGSLIDLTLSHLFTVAVSTLAAAVVAVGLAIFVTRPAGAEFLALSRAVVNIVEGIRLSAVIGLATATIGSTVAAKGLGEVIVAGLLSNNLAFIVQGGVITGVLAVLISDGFQAVARQAAKRRGARPQTET